MHVCGFVCLLRRGEGVVGVKAGCQRTSSGGEANQEEFNFSCCHSQPAVMMLGQWTQHFMISLHPDNWRWLKAAVLRPDQTASAISVLDRLCQWQHISAALTRPISTDKRNWGDSAALGWWLQFFLTVCFLLIFIYLFNIFWGWGIKY